MEVNIVSLNPCSLVMTHEECFYCKNSDDTLRMYLVDRLYGMKACSNHYVNAESDIKSFMKKNNIVHISDALLDKDISNFFNYFGDNMKIIRSSGSVDDGWALMKTHYDCIPSLKQVKGKWCFPVIKDNGKFDYISKMVEFAQMKNPKLEYHKDNNFDMLLELAVNAIEKILSSYPEKKEKSVDYYNNIYNVFECVAHGKLGRVFIPA